MSTNSTSVRLPFAALVLAMLLVSLPLAGAIH